jgi:hypothetical protein
VSEDNRTIVHHKVAAKVYCVFNQDDTALSARFVAAYWLFGPVADAAGNWCTTKTMTLALVRQILVPLDLPDRCWLLAGSLAG